MPGGRGIAFRESVWGGLITERRRLEIQGQILVFPAYRDEMTERAQIHDPVRNSWGCMRLLAEVDLCELLELVRGFDDGQLPLIIHRVKLAIDANRGSIKRAANSLFPNNVAGIGLVTMDDAAIAPTEDSIPDGDRCRYIRRSARHFIGDYGLHSALLGAGT